jgi:hypothetical protein
MATLTRRRLVWLALGLAWLTLAAFSGGCDGLFRPATPELPTNSTPIPTDYSDPDATLETLALGLAARGQNGGTEAYLGAFADDRTDGVVYHMFYDPADSADHAQFGGVPLWTLTLEQAFYQRFYNNFGGNFRMIWRVDEANPDGDPSTPERTIHREYTVFTFPPEDSTDVHVISNGFADLTFFLTPQGHWVIETWSDHIGPPIDAENEVLTLGRWRLTL